MKTRLVAFGVFLALPIGAAVAQPSDPNEPYPATAPTPPAPITPPPIEQPPTVIINPPARATVVSTEPAYETVEDSWNAPVFSSGAVTFAASYGASVIAAGAMDDNDRDRWGERLYVPIAGPWLALNDYGNNCPITNINCDDETTTKVLLVADGVFQAAGAITMVAGLASPTHHRRVVRGYADTKIHVRPTVVGHAGNGVTVFGRF